MPATADPISTRPAAISWAPAAFAAAALPWLYLVYALPAVVFLSVFMPPFQVADEFAHALRADQITRGKIVSDRLGGKVHAHLAHFGELYQSMWFHSEVKQTVELAREAGKIRWTGAIREVNFQNTAQYGPLLYLPQAIGLRLGTLVDLSVPQTILLARLANGVTACLIGFLALVICRRGRALMFATLLLPMTLSQFASVSQDALIISLSLAVIAVASRVLSEERAASVQEFAAFCLVVVATTWARPPQLALGLLAPAFVTWHDPYWRVKTVLAVCAAGLIAAWMVVLVSLIPPGPADWSISGQFTYLVEDLLALPTVTINTFLMQGSWLWATVIGYLGWLDAPMPAWYIRAASVALIIAAVVPHKGGPSLWPAFLALVTFVGLFVGICVTLYLSWTPVGKPTIDGLQGRYILPVLPLLGWAMSVYRPSLERIANWAWSAVILFPIVTLGCLPGTLMERYYGSWSAMAASPKVLLL